MGQGNIKPQVNCFWAHKVSQINGKPARLQLGAACLINKISHTAWVNLGQPSITETEKSPTSASGGTVKLTGQPHCCVSLITRPSQQAAMSKKPN